MSSSTIELHAGKLRLALRADLGGSIAGLWLGGVPVMRSTEPALLQGARQSGSFPLVPYSNRLAHRRFTWQGQNHTTVPNFDDSPHSLHGVVWQRPWEVLSASADAAELQYLHSPDTSWPFAFEARQRVVLQGDTLELQLAMTNRATQPQPVGLGWHPYFPKRSGSQLQMAVTQRWDSEPTGLPTQRVPQAGIHGAVAQMDFDNCFEGWGGRALIADEVLNMELTSSLPYAVVFTPPDKPYYCVEPVSHVNDAIHMADPLANGVRVLLPGEGYSAWMRLRVQAA